MGKCIIIYREELPKNVWTPHKAVNDLGIEFNCVAFRIFLGYWEFQECINVPDELPDYMHLENKKNDEDMKRYRIVTEGGYNGCIPITVYWVQVRKDTVCGETWENVKGFDSYERALSLYNILI